MCEYSRGVEKKPVGKNYCKLGFNLDRRKMFAQNEFQLIASITLVCKKNFFPLIFMHDYDRFDTLESKYSTKK